MSQYLITIYRPKAFDPASDVDEEMLRAIDKLNDEMVESGVRVFVGGLKSTKLAGSLRYGVDGTVIRSDGTYLDAEAFLDGLWILEAPDAETAKKWGHKAAIACRASVELRPFHG